MSGLAATLLAAGQGKRLGGVPKPALRIDGQSLFERLVQALRQAGVQDIRAVIGPYADVLVPLARQSGVRVIPQTVPDAPLVASQRLAVADHLRHHPTGCEGHDLLLLVADLPLLTGDDTAPLLQAWHRRPAHIHAQMPQVNGVRGHPVCLSWQAVQAVAALPAEQGVRDWLAAATDATQVLACDREGCVWDLDTPEDLVALRARLHPVGVGWADRTD